jgi:hypothetical protein
MTVLFRPMGLVTGLIAGILARKVFEKGWSSFNDEEAPSPEQESLSLKKLAIALLLEGAVFSLVRGLADHGSRVAFRKYTGAWPGDDGDS